MDHFVTDVDHKEIHADWWADGETVTIKLFTYVDKQRLFERSLVGTPRVDEDGNVRFRLDTALHTETSLVMGIVAWTFTDADGEPVPCDSEHRCALNPRDGQFIYNEIQELNKERTAEEQDSF